MTKIIRITFLILILFPCIVFAQEIKPGEVLTLERCIDIATENNPNIDLAQQATKVYKSKIGQSKSGYLPQFSVSTGYSRANPITTYADENTNQYSGSASLNQLIYDFGKTPTKVKIQSLNLDSSRFDVNNMVLQIAYNVKQAYYGALSAKISRDIYTEAIKQYEQHLKQARAFYNAGFKSKIDVTTAEVNLSNVKLQQIKADDTYKTAMASLNNAMGIPNPPPYNIIDTFIFKRPSEPKVADKSGSKSKQQPVKGVILKAGVEKHNILENLAFKKYDISFEDALKRAYENRPDLKSLVVKETAANESVKLAKKDYFPSLSGFASYGWGGRSFPLDNGWSAGANINLPVFNAALTKYQVDEAKANVDIARSNLEILRQNIYLQIQQAYISLTEAEKRIPVVELTVKQAKENLELANGRYKVGVGNSIEVQDAEVNYNNAQLSYVQVLYDYSTARSNLERAMGVR